MRTWLFILLGLTLGGLSTSTVVRSYTWNGHTYTFCTLPDGSQVEIKGAVGEKPAAALAKADKMYAEMQVQLAAEKAAEEAKVALDAEPRLSTATTAQLKAEVTKRRLTAADLGLAVAPK